MEIKLTILEEDIRDFPYLDSMTCPITRALARAGMDDYRDVGGCVKSNDENRTIHIESKEVYLDMTYRIIGAQIFLGISYPFKSLSCDEKQDAILKEKYVKAPETFSVVLHLKL